MVLWARPGNSPGHSLSPGSGLAGDWAATEMRRERGGEGQRQAGRGTLPLGQVQPIKHHRELLM